MSSTSENVMSWATVLFAVLGIEPKNFVLNYTICLAFLFCILRQGLVKLLSCLSWAGTCNPPFLASHRAGIIDVCTIILS